MTSSFETARFNLVKADKVKIGDHRLNNNSLSELNVWIESDGKGKRFMWQITAEGDKYPLCTGVYTRKCYILCEKASNKYFFLDMNDYGIWLFNQHFFGSENFAITEASKIDKWLAESS